MSKEIGFQIGDKKTLTEEKKKSSPPEDELKNVFSELMKTYKPATKKTANSSMSTNEFWEKLQEHYPAFRFLGTDVIYEMLKTNGYVYAAIGENIEWLIKK
jgi:hypothetical protein